MFDHTNLASQVGQALVDRKESVAVGESSAGGRSRGLLFDRDELPPDTRGATHDFACALALNAADRMRADWGLAETGATGPSGNPYGDPAGHAWVAVRRPDGTTVAHNVTTGSDDRATNMAAFAQAALELLLSELAATPST